ncbi:IclR family transcriptional regulator [Saccharospirillum sp.]|uniref:IclR family transcriptional regulator n=1 Tax=Saccharospirillum sp. TaxID=2033801 RepID=UPI0034A08D80
MSELRHINQKTEKAGNSADDKKSRGLSSLANAIALLKTFSEKDVELGISELSKRLGLAKSTVHRMATTLVIGGLLEKNTANDKYRLGLTLFSLGGLVRRRLDVPSVARPILQELKSELNETVLLGVLDGPEVVYLFHFESTHAIRMQSDIGVRKEALCTGEGQVILAFKSDVEIDEALSGTIKQRTNYTITDPAELRKKLLRIRAQGYCVEDQESEVGMRCIAAPIFNMNGEVVAGMGLAGPIHRMDEDTILRYVPHVQDTARAVSQRLGYRPF